MMLDHISIRLIARNCVVSDPNQSKGRLALKLLGMDSIVPLLFHRLGWCILHLFVSIVPATDFSLVPSTLLEAFVETLQPHLRGVRSERTRAKKGQLLRDSL